MLKFETVDHYPSPPPHSYQQNPQFPILRGTNHCRYCLCTPCVIWLPPDFLRGSASLCSANDEKRHRLYHLFWKLLSDVGLWQDEEYLQMKEGRIAIYDKREIIPKCVITVSTLQHYVIHIAYLSLYLTQEIRSRYPSHDGQYRDYKSMFEAEFPRVEAMDSSTQQYSPPSFCSLFLLPYLIMINV